MSDTQSDRDPFADAMAVVRSLVRRGDDVADIIVDRYSTDEHSLRELINGMAQLVILLAGAAGDSDNRSAMDVLDEMINQHAAGGYDRPDGGTLRDLGGGERES